MSRSRPAVWLFLAALACAADRDKADIADSDTDTAGGDSTDSSDSADTQDSSNSGDSAPTGDSGDSGSAGDSGDSGSAGDSGDSGALACTRSVLGGTVPTPLAFWTMDASSITGTALADLQSAAPGTLVGGLSTTAGVCGEGLDLDGVDDFVQIDNESLFDFSTATPFTIAAWVKVPGTLGPFVFGKSDNGLAAGGAPGYYAGLRDTANNHRALLDLLNDPGNLGRRVQTSTGGYVDDTWHHLVYIYDGSNTVAGITFVVDGQSVASSTITNSNPGSILNDVKPAIGIRGTGSSDPAFRPFQVDELGVWGVALSVTQAQALYAALGGGAP